MIKSGKTLAMKIHMISALIAAAALAGCGEEKQAAAAAPEPADNAAEAQPTNTAAAAEEPISLADEGRRRFAACAVCHSVNEGEPARVGPNLFGIVGRTAGTNEDFAYSKAMAEAGIVWTEENLDAFIENPQNFMRGNRMAYVGERKPENRAAMIAYLKTLTSATD